MDIEENKKAVLQIVEEADNKGNLSVVDELLSPEFIGHGPDGREVRGHAGYKQSVEMYRITFPDLNFTIEDMVAEGDKIAWRYTLRATFSGPFGNIQPTGNKIIQAGISLWRFQDGKLAEAWGYSDRLEMYKQMGIKPVF